MSTPRQDHESPPAPAPRPPVVDFAAQDAVAGWRVVDDGVMGGRSAGGFGRSQDGFCVFSGRLSLEAGGGFSSVRSGELGAGFADASAVVLTCRGDGLRYKLRLYTRGASEGMAYQAGFATLPGEWLERAFEPRDFTAVRRGRALPAAPPLALADVVGVGLLISDRQAGPFRLELRSIEGR